MENKVYDEMKEVVICKHCNKHEYYGEMRWFDGKCSCRNCYKRDYEKRIGEKYTWDDLDGPRPTTEEIKNMGVED